MIGSRGFWYGVKKFTIPQQIAKRGAGTATNLEVNYGTKQKAANGTRPSHVRTYEDIPGPEPLPIIGNMFRFVPYISKYGNLSFLEQLQLLRDTYGDMVKLHKMLNRQPVVLVFDPKLAETVYRHQGTFPIRSIFATQKYYRMSKPETYNGNYGLFTSQGKEWSTTRTMMNPLMMQPRAIVPYIQLLDEISNDMMARMLEIRDPKTLELSPGFNDIIAMWALEGVCGIALNSRLGCLETDLPEDSDPQLLTKASVESLQLMYELEMYPSLWKFYKTPKLKRLFRSMDRIASIVEKYIDQAKEEFKKRPEMAEHERNMLQKLLSKDETVGHVMAVDMFFAGFDTVSNGGSAMLYFLANNPKKQEKLREEAMSLLPTKDSQLSYEALNQSTYGKACIKESLRLFPLLEGVFRNMQEDVILGGYEIPKGTTMLCCHSVMALDSKQFPRPQEFIPERWLKDSGEYPSSKTAHPFAYQPFGFGARNCVGKRFAETELNVMALKMVRNFKLEWNYGPLQTEKSITQTVTTPLTMKVTEI